MVKMLKEPAIKIWLIVSCILSLGLGAVLFVCFEPLNSWRYQHIQFHSSVEALGGITGILISVILFNESRRARDLCLMMVATGFVSMGLLDTAHAISLLGDSFIFLHSVASLFCGFFFALQWATDRPRTQRRSEYSFVYWGAIILSLSIAIRALVNPADVPKIMPLFDGEFTMAAVIINTLASVLFLISVPKFYALFKRNRLHRDLLFMFLAFYFGIAEMIFQFSHPWNAIWWIWHLIRFIVFIGTLIFVSNHYLTRADR